MGGRVSFLVSHSARARVVIRGASKAVRSLTTDVGRLLGGCHDVKRRVRQDSALFQSAVADLSRSLQAPLTATGNCVRLLRRRSLAKRRGRCIAVTKREVSTMGLLLSRLFRFMEVRTSRLGLGYEGASVRDMLQSIITSCCNSFRRGGYIPCVIVPGPPTVV